jgi:hypothetical protein
MQRIAIGVRHIGNLSMRAEVRCDVVADQVPIVLLRRWPQPWQVLGHEAVDQPVVGAERSASICSSGSPPLSIRPMSNDERLPTTSNGQSQYGHQG